MRCKNCIHLDVCYEHDIIGADDNGMCTSYEPDRPHGEWLSDSVHVAFKCSFCGGISLKDYAFCPHCGADMRKGGEAE